MTTWQYMLVRILGVEDITGLTRLGEEGWEAFAAVPIVANNRTEGSVMFLKRPLAVGDASWSTNFGKAR